MVVVTTSSPGKVGRARVPAPGSVCCGWDPAAPPRVADISTLCCSGSLAKRTAEGNTPLHYCCSHNKPECVKLLLRAQASITISEWPRDSPSLCSQGVFSEVPP